MLLEFSVHISLVGISKEFLPLNHHEEIICGICCNINIVNIHSIVSVC